MRHRGFIFSLDAFVAFTLTMITVSLLIFTIGTPKPYYYSLEQAHQLAHDTLTALAASTDSVSHGTYLEQVLGGGSGTVNDIMFKVAGGREGSPVPPNYRPIIPKGYGYRLERYQFTGNTWSVLYDSGNDAHALVKGCDYGSDRCGKAFTKLQASATTFASFYIDKPNPGASPYCYLSCQGYSGPGNPVSLCNTTPCDRPISNFYPGNNSIAIVRLTVYT